MSAPLCLYISYDGEKFTDVDLDRRAASQLADCLLQFVTEYIPEHKDDFQGVLDAGSISITRISRLYFTKVYTTIMQACDTIESLAPYKAELKEKLEADERFEVMQKA